MKLRSQLILALLPALIAIFLIGAFWLHLAEEKSLPFLTSGEVSTLTNAGLWQDPTTFPITSLIAICLVIATCLSVAFITQKICKPLEAIRKGALSMAAGNYKAPLHLLGAAEDLADIANSLNTLSDCLDHANTSTSERRLSQEPLSGEYESALLLQQHCLQSKIENHPFPEQVNLRLLSHLGYGELSGTFFDITNDEDAITFYLAQAQEKGLIGFYDLLCAPQDHPRTRITLQDTQVVAESHQSMPMPFLWSCSLKKLQRLSSSPHPFETGDFLFVATLPLYHLFQEESLFCQWLERPLEQFASEGLEACMAMLSKELSFITRRRHITEDLHLLAVEKL